MCSKSFGEIIWLKFATPGWSIIKSVANHWDLSFKTKQKNCVSFYE